MQNDTSELDQMQTAYKVAVEEWITAIRQEEVLASVNHSIAEVDKWEGAHFAEDKIRSKVKAAKKQYEDALRKKFYNF
jgi:hypothetical protein